MIQNPVNNIIQPQEQIDALQQSIVSLQSLTTITPISYEWANGITQGGGDVTIIWRFQNLLFMNIHANLPTGSGWTDAIILPEDIDMQAFFGKAPYANSSTPSNIAYSLGSNTIGFYLNQNTTTTVGFAAIAFLN